MSRTPADRPRFVICVGSQRAGSTLLHRLLSESTPIYMHPLKEIHYFDTVLRTRAFVTLRRYCQHVADQRAGRRASWRRRLRVRGAGGVADANVQRALDLILGCDAPEDLARIPYLDLYQPAAMRFPVLGEASPEYMLLPVPGLQFMRGVVGEDTRIVLLRRDPVQRFLSSYSLRHAYLNDADFNPTTLDEVVMLADVRRDAPWVAEQVAYSDYDYALQAYRQVFPHVLDLTLDSLTSGDPAVARELADFLDVPVDRSVFRAVALKRINALGEFTVSTATRKELGELLAGYMARRRTAIAGSGPTAPGNGDHA